VPYISLSAFNEHGDILGTHYGRSYAAPFIAKHDGIAAYLRPIDDGVRIDAVDFNNRRQVVGHFEGAPYIWDPENKFRDLNILSIGHLPSAHEPAIATVSAINEFGWVAGAVRAANSTVSNPALFVPVPIGDSRYIHLARLSGPRLCKALNTLQTRAALCKRKAANP
jgi:hypothetical protein